MENLANTGYILMLGLGIAISPVPIIVVILILCSDKAKTNGIYSFPVAEPQCIGTNRLADPSK